jgi:hypothetical protein
MESCMEPGGGKINQKPLGAPADCSMVSVG